MPSDPTVAAMSTRAVVEAARRRGVGGSLLTDHGLTPATLADPHARLPARVVAAVWRDAAMRAGEPELPVWAALELPWGAYRVIDVLAASAETFGEALGLISHYFRIVHDTTRLPIETHDGGGTMRIIGQDGGAVPPPYVDYTLSACIHRLGLAGARVHPEVHLVREAPKDVSAHVRALGPNLVFGAEADWMTFDAAQWATPIPTSDPVLRSVLGEHADRLVSELPHFETDPLQEVVDVIQEALPRGRAEVAYVARRLGVSTRTLQRRLSEHDSSWRALLNRTRRDLAEQLLRDPSLCVDEVAVLLGYSEASTFHRAFRRWAGTTPGAWRAGRLEPRARP